MRLTKIEGPGKFEGEFLVTVHAYEALLHGLGDDSASYPDGGDCYDLIWYPQDAAGLSDPDGLDPLSAEDREYLAGQVGAILFTRSDGFVYGEFFSDEDTLRAKWAEIEGEVYYGLDDAPEEGGFGAEYPGGPVTFHRG